MTYLFDESTCKASTTNLCRTFPYSANGKSFNNLIILANQSLKYKSPQNLGNVVALIQKS